MKCDLLETIVTIFLCPIRYTLGKTSSSRPLPSLLTPSPPPPPIRHSPVNKSCYNHRWPTCHFVENFRILFFSYSFESWAVFGFFFFLFLFNDFWNSKNIYTSPFWQGITSHFQPYQRIKHALIQNNRPCHGF